MLQILRIYRTGLSSEISSNDQNVLRILTLLYYLIWKNELIKVVFISVLPSLGK